MNDVENSPLLVVRNTRKLSSEKTNGEVYDFITSNGKPLAFRSDDDKAIKLYGKCGEIVPASEAGSVDLEIRDHRQDEIGFLDNIEDEES